MKWFSIGRTQILAQVIAKQTQLKVSFPVVLLYAIELIFLFSPMQINYRSSSFIVFPGRDAAFIGPSENHFAILDDDKTGLSLYILPGAALQEANNKNGMVDADQNMDTEPTDVTSVKGPMQFMFESEIDRIFSTPIGTHKEHLTCLTSHAMQKI